MICDPCHELAHAPLQFALRQRYLRRTLPAYSHEGMPLICYVSLPDDFAGSGNRLDTPFIVVSFIFLMILKDETALIEIICSRNNAEIQVNSNNCMPRSSYFKTGH